LEVDNATQAAEKSARANQRIVGDGFLAREPLPVARQPSAPSAARGACDRRPNSCGSAQTEPGTSNPNPAVKETGATGRESNGRFAKSNRGGPGNPFARQVAAFRACLLNSVTQDDLKEIVYQLLELAKDGELQAIKLLFSYLLGTPKPVVEPDELDLHEMHLAHQTALAAEALQEAAPARPSANDAPLPLDGPVESPAASVHEAPPPSPASAPSTKPHKLRTVPPDNRQRAVNKPRCRRFRDWQTFAAAVNKQAKR
jgi:hypothetical protein